MQDFQIIPLQAKDHKYVIDIMNTLSDYFSPETIQFAEEKISTLQGFIAIKKAEIVGFIAFEILDISTCKIYRMGILPEYQRQGIGSLLMKFTETILQKQNIKVMKLLTLDEHPDYPGYLFTRNFYIKHGFGIDSFYMEGDIKILTMCKLLH